MNIIMVMMMMTMMMPMTVGAQPVSLNGAYLGTMHPLLNR
jgi:hypothetical protein